jgi:hypothetical protein
MAVNEDDPGSNVIPISKIIRGLGVVLRDLELPSGHVLYIPSS